MILGSGCDFGGNLDLDIYEKGRNSECICVHTHTRSRCERLCVYVCRHMCVYRYINLHIRICICAEETYTYTYVCICTGVDLHMDICMGMCTPCNTGPSTQIRGNFSQSEVRFQIQKPQIPQIWVLWTLGPRPGQGPGRQGSGSVALEGAGPDALLSGNPGSVGRRPFQGNIPGGAMTQRIQSTEKFSICGFCTRK